MIIRRLAFGLVLLIGIAIGSVAQRGLAAQRGAKDFELWHNNLLLMTIHVPTQPVFVLSFGTPNGGPLPQGSVTDAGNGTAALAQGTQLRLFGGAEGSLTVNVTGSGVTLKPVN